MAPMNALFQPTLAATVAADVAFVALSIAFFAGAAAFAWFCERIR